MTTRLTKEQLAQLRESASDDRFPMIVELSQTDLLKLLDQLTAVQSELALCRERLGPAGINMLVKMKADLSEALANEQASATAYAEVKAELAKVTKRAESAELEADTLRDCGMEYEEMQSELAIARDALKFLIDHSPHDDDESACVYCDMGDAGYSSKGPRHHDDKRYVCPVVVAMRALAGAEPKSRGE